MVLLTSLLHKPVAPSLRRCLPDRGQTNHRENITALWSWLCGELESPVRAGSCGGDPGPGLAPALEVGIAAKTFAAEHELPLIAINHIELISSLLATKEPAWKHFVFVQQVVDINFPVVSVVVSGGHTQFVVLMRLAVMSQGGRWTTPPASAGQDRPDAQSDIRQGR